MSPLIISAHHVWVSGRRRRRRVYRGSTAFSRPQLSDHGIQMRQSPRKLGLQCTVARLLWGPPTARWIATLMLCARTVGAWSLPVAFNFPSSARSAAARMSRAWPRRVRCREGAETLVGLVDASAVFMMPKLTYRAPPYDPRRLTISTRCSKTCDADECARKRRIQSQSDTHLPRGAPCSTF